MASFEVDFNKINENIRVLNQDLSEYKSLLDEAKNVSLGIEPSWRDDKTAIFINTVNLEYKKIMDHYDSMKKYIGVIKYFCESVSSAITRRDQYAKINKVRFDSTILKSAINDLDSALENINKAIDKFTGIEYPLDFLYRDLLIQYARELNRHYSSLENLKNKLDKINSEILSIINTCKTKNSMIEFIDVDKSVVKYNWHVSVDSLKNTEIKETAFDKQASTNSGLRSSFDSNSKIVAEQYNGDVGDASLKGDVKESSITNNNGALNEGTSAMQNIDNTIIEARQNTINTEGSILKQNLEDETYDVNSKSYAETNQVQNRNLNDSNYSINNKDNEITHSEQSGMESININNSTQNNQTINNNNQSNSLNNYSFSVSNNIDTLDNATTQSINTININPNINNSDINSSIDIDSLK